MGPIGLLFWLKRKLMLRGFRRSASSVIGAVLMLLVFGPFAVGIALLVFFGLRGYGVYASRIMEGVLTGIYLFWLLAPIVGFSLNDSYDITKLFVFPISLRQIFTGAVLGSLLDISTLLVLPTLIAVIVGFSHSLLGFSFILLAVALFLFHTLTLSQGILLLSSGVLKSRRFRDLSLIFFSIFGMLYYVGTRVLTRAIETNGPNHIHWDALFNHPVWNVIDLLPSGSAALSASHAASASWLGIGELGPAVLWLLLLAAYTVGAVYLFAGLLQKVYAGEEVGLKRRVKTEGEKGRRGEGEKIVGEKGRRGEGEQKPFPNERSLPLSTGQGVSGGSDNSVTVSPTPLLPFSPSVLPPVVQAVVEKEVKYLFRDPYFKVFLSSIVYVLFAMGYSLFMTSGRAGAHFGNYGIWMTTVLLPLVEMGLICNQFGNDGAAVTMLFLYPCPRRQILFGKNLTIFLALSIVNGLAVVVLSAIAQMLNGIGLLFLWLELSLAVMLAAGNFLSIYFPYRIVMRGWRIRYGSGTSGFGYFMLYLGMMFLIFFILIPVLLAIILPMAFKAGAWFVLSLPLAALYAAGLYLLSLKFAGPLLMKREPEIIAKLTANE